MSAGLIAETVIVLGICGLATFSVERARRPRGAWTPWDSDRWRAGLSGADSYTGKHRGRS